MGKAYPIDSIPEFRAGLDAGNWLAAIEQLDDTQPTSTGKYQIRAVFRTTEPVAGLPHFHNFVIGNDTDPEADDPETWKGVAARMFVSMLKSAGIAGTGDMEEDIAAATGQIVGFDIRQRVEPATNPKTGAPNQYAGTVRSEVGRFFKPGEREVGIAEGNGAAPAPVAKAPAKAAPAVSRAAVPAAAPKAAPKAASAPAPAAKAAPASAPKKSEALKCTICGEMVAKAEFGEHISNHESEEE